MKIELVNLSFDNADVYTFYVRKIFYPSLIHICNNITEKTIFQISKNRIIKIFFKILILPSAQVNSVV